MRAAGSKCAVNLRQRRETVTIDASHAVLELFSDRSLLLHVHHSVAKVIPHQSCDLDCAVGGC